MAAASGSGTSAAAFDTSAAAMVVPLALTEHVSAEAHSARVSAAGRPAGDLETRPRAAQRPECSAPRVDIDAITAQIAERAHHGMEADIESLLSAQASMNADLADMHVQIQKIRKQEAALREAIKDIERKRSLRAAPPAGGPQDPGARVLAMAGQFATHLENRLFRWIWNCYTLVPSVRAPVKVWKLSHLDSILQQFDETGAPRDDGVLEAMRAKYGNDPGFTMFLSDRGFRAGTCERWHQLVSACPTAAQDLSSLREMCGGYCWLPRGTTAETLADAAELALRAACDVGAEELEESLAGEPEFSWVVDDLRRSIVFLLALSSAEPVLRGKAA